MCEPNDLCCNCRDIRSGNLSAYEFCGTDESFVIVRQHERKIVENIELSSCLEGQQVTATDIAKVKKNSRTVSSM